MAIVLGFATAVSCVGFIACNEITSIVKEEIYYTLSADKSYYIVKGSGWNKGSELTVPESKDELPVKEIAARGFEGEWLTELVVGDTVEVIGERAFHTCWELSKVHIGASVTQIGDLAFASCVELDEITVSEDNAAYKSLDGNLYDIQMTTLVQYAVGKSAETFVLPETVVTIEDKALADSLALKTVVLGASVREIGVGAFSNENISGELEIGVERIFYMGDSDGWNNVSVGENNGRISETSLYFYSASWKSGNYWRYVDGEPKAWNEEE
ncbi:MAG: leucine-rich repeat domain-containing protein [Clostridia bacterium]|nr:leucine-rich repeat domain-containing protein [Clostridia bacterium]